MQKPCYVKTGTIELTKEVISMAKRAGFDRPYSRSETYTSGVMLGPWEDGHPEYGFPGFYFATSSWEPEIWMNTLHSRKHWPSFDVSTEKGMSELKAYWFPEEQFDATPLPHFTMTPEQEKETKSKFNMSDDQWEALPLNAKKALCGENVQIVESMPYKWIPIDVVTDPVRNCTTVMFSTVGTAVIGSADCLAFGYFTEHDEDEDRYVPNIVGKSQGFEGEPTHYAVIPTEELAPGEEPKVPTWVNKW